MGSHLNFKNFRNDSTEGSGGSGGGRPLGKFLFAPQSSINSWTSDKFPSAMGGIGKDFGSPNVDELLKNIWSAEEKEIQSMKTARGAAQDVGPSVGNLQRQGSLTLPRMLSKKTVDDVWGDIVKWFTVGEKDNSGVGHTSMPRGQTTLGEMTLEEFLVRACVIREDVEFPGKTNTTGIFGGSPRTWNNIAGKGYAQGPARREQEAEEKDKDQGVGRKITGSCSKKKKKKTKKKSRARKQVLKSPAVSEASVNQPQPEHSSSSSTSSSISQFRKLLRKVTYSNELTSMNEQELSANTRNEGEIQSDPRNDLSSDQMEVDLQLGLSLMPHTTIEKVTMGSGKDFSSNVASGEGEEQKVSQPGT